MSNSSSGCGGTLFGALALGLLGGIFMVGGVALLVFVEKDAVAFASAMEVARKEIVTIDPLKPDPAAQGKLVHLSGKAENAVPLADEAYGILAPGLSLERRMRVYQWQQKKSTSSRKVGKRRKTTTSYSYSQVWSEHLIDSSGFHEREGHENVGVGPIQSFTWMAEGARVGVLRFPADQIEKLDTAALRPVSGEEYARLPENVRGRFRLAAGILYQGRDPASPEIGDVKIEYHVRADQPVTLFGRLTGESITPFEAGTAVKFYSVDKGTKSATEVLDTLSTSNKVADWFFRFGSWLLLFFGIMLGASPLTMMASFIPILGPMVGLGVGLFAFAGATCLCLAIMALFWALASPVFAAILGGAALSVLVLALGYGASKAAPPPAPAPPPAGS